MSEPTSLATRVALASIAATLTAACTVGPDFAPPKAPLPLSWQEAASGMDNAKAMPGMGDPILGRLLVRAEHDNLDLRMAAERIETARALRGLARAQSSPTLNSQASYSRNRLSTEGIADIADPMLGIAPSARATTPKGITFDAISFGAAASWEIDLWGRQRRQNEAASAQMDAAHAQSDGAKLSVKAEIARTYFQWRLAQSMLGDAEAAVHLAEQSKRIVEAMVAHGVAARAELAAPDSRLNAARNQRDEAATRLSMTRRAVTVLVAGRPDAPLCELDEPAPSFSEESVPTMLPSDMARARPDIREAEARLHAATAAIGMAQADFYPSISLTGQFSIDALSLSELGWDARNASFGPTITLPIFSGGKLHRQLELRRSEQRSAALAYQATVIGAWREVEDALALDRLLHRQINAIETDVASRIARLAMLELRARRGDLSEATLLEERAALLDLHSQLETKRTHLLIAKVNLRTALGVGIS